MIEAIAEFNLPWWAWCYAGLLLLLGLAGLDVDIREREPWWFVLGQLFAMSSTLAFVIIYHRPALIATVGLAIIPWLVASLSWDAFEVHRDLHEAELEDRSIARAAFWFVTALLLPAYVMAARLCARAMNITGL
jgi:hypothetical protein